MISELAENELTNLQKAGISPTPAEIIQLNDLGLRVENDGVTLAPHYGGAIVKCGNVVLHQFTVQSGEWFDSYATRFFQTDAMRLYALGFALNLGRDEYLPDWCGDRLTFADLVDKSLAEKCLEAWVLHCGCTVEELNAAITRIIPELRDPHVIISPDGQETDLIAEIVAATGIEAEYWQRQTHDFAWRCLAAAYRQKTLAAGISQNSVADDEYRRNMYNFMMCVKKIREAHGG